jgi:hypothetical protein
MTNHSTTNLTTSTDCDCVADTLTILTERGLLLSQADIDVINLYCEDGRSVEIIAGELFPVTWHLLSQLKAALKFNFNPEYAIRLFELGTSIEDIKQSLIDVNLQKNIPEESPPVGDSPQG